MEPWQPRKEGDFFKATWWPHGIAWLEPASPDSTEEQPRAIKLINFIYLFRSWWDWIQGCSTSGLHLQFFFIFYFETVSKLSRPQTWDLLPQAPMLLGLQAWATMSGCQSHLNHRNVSLILLTVKIADVWGPLWLTGWSSALLSLAGQKGHPWWRFKVGKHPGFHWCFCSLNASLRTVLINIKLLLPSQSLPQHSALGFCPNQSTSVVNFKSMLRRIMFGHFPAWLYLHVLGVMIQRESIGHCILKIRVGILLLGNLVTPINLCLTNPLKIWCSGPQLSPSFQGWQQMLQSKHLY